MGTCLMECDLRPCMTREIKRQYIIVIGVILVVTSKYHHLVRGIQYSGLPKTIGCNVVVHTDSCSLESVSDISRNIRLVHLGCDEISIVETP